MTSQYFFASSLLIICLFTYSLAQIYFWPFIIDDLMSIQRSSVLIQVAHLQAEEVLFGDHGGNFIAAKIVQCQRLHISLSIPSAPNHYKAPHGKRLNLLSKLLIVQIDVLVVIAMHNQPLEGLKAVRVDDSAGQPGKQEPDTVLTDSVDALDVRAVLALVSHKDGASSANYLELVLVATVSMQIPAQLACDEVHFFHLLGGLSDQLSRGELAPHQSVVRLDVLDVGIADFTPEKVEIFHLLVILDLNWGLNI